MFHNVSTLLFKRGKYVAYFYLDKECSSTVGLILFQVSWKGLKIYSFSPTWKKETFNLQPLTYGGGPTWLLWKMHYSFFTFHLHLEDPCMGLKFGHAFAYQRCSYFQAPIVGPSVSALRQHFPFCRFTPPRILSYLESLYFLFCYLLNSLFVFCGRSSGTTISGSRKSELRGA